MLDIYKFGVYFFILLKKIIIYKYYKIYYLYIMIYDIICYKNFNNYIFKLCCIFNVLF